MIIRPYIVPPEKLVHRTLVDFGGKRMVQKTLHFMQYDRTLPIVEVTLFNNGNKYYIPELGSSCKVRLSKPDKTFVYKDVLGCSEDGNLVYFEMDEQMTVINGQVEAILELIISGSVAGSSYINIIIDKNPVQEDDIESSIEAPLAPVAFTGDFYDLSNRPETMGTVVKVESGYGLKGGPITTSGTISVDTDIIATKEDIVASDTIKVVNNIPSELTEKDMKSLYKVNEEGIYTINKITNQGVQTYSPSKLSSESYVDDKVGDLVDLTMVDKTINF